MEKMWRSYRIKGLPQDDFTHNFPVVLVTLFAPFGHISIYSQPELNGIPTSQPFQGSWTRLVQLLPSPTRNWHSIGSRNCSQTCSFKGNWRTWTRITFIIHSQFLVVDIVWFIGFLSIDSKIDQTFKPFSLCPHMEDVCIWTMKQLRQVAGTTDGYSMSQIRFWWQGLIPMLCGEQSWSQGLSI